MIFLLNGAPGSGKDTVADMACEINPNGEMMKFAKPLKDAVPVFYNVSPERWAELDTLELKDLPAEEFYGQTPRQVQINLSETFAKPMHGKYIFGEMAIRRMEESNADMFFISDSGFREEAEAVVNRYGAALVTLVRITRDGFDFSKDSRGYIDLSDLGVNLIEIKNDSTLENLRLKVEKLLDVKGAINND